MNTSPCDTNLVDEHKPRMTLKLDDENVLDLRTLITDVQTQHPGKVDSLKCWRAANGNSSTRKKKSIFVARKFTMMFFLILDV